MTSSGKMICTLAALEFASKDLQLLQEMKLIYDTVESLIII